MQDQADLTSTAPRTPARLLGVSPNSIQGAGVGTVPAPRPTRDIQPNGWLDRPHGAGGGGPFGVVRMDAMGLPASSDGGGAIRRRCLFVAIDQASRYAHLSIKEAYATASAIAFVEEIATTLPFRIDSLLTDSSPLYAVYGFKEACRRYGIRHRRMASPIPEAAGLMEGFMLRVRQGAIDPAVQGGDEIEAALADYAVAYNGLSQRVLKGLSPEMTLRQREGGGPGSAGSTSPPADA